MKVQEPISDKDREPQEIERKEPKKRRDDKGTSAGIESNKKRKRMNHQPSPKVIVAGTKPRNKKNGNQVQNPET